MRVTRFLVAVPFLCATFVLAGPEPPTDDALQRFVKGKLPGHLTIKYVEVQSRKATATEAVVSGKLVAVVGQHLFSDVTTEAIPELESRAELPAGLTAPAIIKKLHGSGEILELPVAVRFEMREGRWEGEALDDQGAIAKLGQPQDAHKLDAVVFGSSQATRVIAQFRKDLGKASAGGKKPAPARTTAAAPAAAEEKPDAQGEEEAKPEEKKPLTRKERLDALLAGTRSGKSYKGLMAGANGLGSATLRFDKNDHDGAEVVAEIVHPDDAFNRRTFMGRVRENPDIPSQWELYLVGVEVPKTRETGSNAAAPVVKKTHLVLTLDDEGNLVGDTSTSRGAPLTKQKMEKKDYALSFRP